MLFWRKKVVDNTNIEASSAPWQGCIAVCSKCARKVRAMEGDKTRLRVALKALIKDRGLKKLVRPVDSSCLDVCPEGLITVAHFSPHGTQIVNVGSTADPQAILSHFKLL